MGSKGRGRRLKPHRLAEKLKMIRESLDLKQTQIPKALELDDDLTQGMISSFEAGVREPSLIVLLAYARLAGVMMESLVDDKMELDYPKKQSE